MPVLTPDSLWPLGLFTSRTDCGTPLDTIWTMSPRVSKSSCDPPVRTCDAGLEVVRAGHVRHEAGVGVHPRGVDVLARRHAA